MLMLFVYKSLSRQERRGLFFTLPLPFVVDRLFYHAVLLLRRSCRPAHDHVSAHALRFPASLDPYLFYFALAALF